MHLFIAHTCVCLCYSLYFYILGISVHFLNRWMQHTRRCASLCERSPPVVSGFPLHQSGQAAAGHLVSLCINGHDETLSHTSLNTCTLVPGQWHTPSRVRAWVCYTWPYQGHTQCWCRVCVCVCVGPLTSSTSATPLNVCLFSFKHRGVERGCL